MIQYTLFTVRNAACVREDLTGISTVFIEVNVYEKIVCFCLSSHVKYNTNAINFEGTKNAYATIQACNCTYSYKGIDSGPAAIAAQCANEEGNFSHFHNLLYNKQGPVDSGWVNNANSKKFASQIPDSSRA